MAGLKEIRNRIGSVKSTQQMTKAMKMVSAARLKTAQTRILNLRDYAEALKEVVGDLACSYQIQHPFLEQKTHFKKVLNVVITSDRGLCGGFNGNLCRFTEKLLKENRFQQEDLFFIGKKGRDYFKFRDRKGVQTVLGLVKEISYPLASQLAEDLMKSVFEGNYEAVFLIYNEFKTVIQPQMRTERFLPFDLSSVEKSSSPEILFEVPPEEMLEVLLKKYFSIKIYSCLCESVAAEHGSRMTAMENATTNAQDVMSHLTLTYNKLRQSAITTELAEIVGGVEAMKI